MGSLDDFFNKKDKAKKGKGFVTFKEEIDKKQKEIERQKRSMDDEATDVEEKTIGKSERTTQTRANNAKDEWNEVLEPSVLNDVLPDDDFFDDEQVDEITSNGIYNDNMESDSNSVVNIECPIPVGIVIGEIADLKITETEKSENGEKIENEPSSEVPDVVVVGETKRMTRFGAVINKKAQDVKIDSQEDFPVLSLAVGTEKKKMKANIKSSAPSASDSATKASSTVSSSSRFFSSTPKTSQASVPTSAKPAVVQPQSEDLKKFRVSPSVKPSETSTVKSSDVAPSKPRFVSANTTSSTGGSTFSSLSKTPVKSPYVPFSGTTSSNPSTEKTSMFNRKTTETPTNSVSNAHFTPAPPNIPPTGAKPAGPPRFVRAKS